MKVPPDEFTATVAFYRDTLGFPVLDPNNDGSVIFDFGGKRLWIDNVPALSRAEVWLEVVTSDSGAAAQHLNEHGIVRRDDIEPLPEGMAAFWIKSPSGIIHLVTEEENVS